MNLDDTLKTERLISTLKCVTFCLFVAFAHFSCYFQSIWQMLCE